MVYWVSVGIAWHTRPWLGAPGLLWFVIVVAAVVVAANLRLHLWFSARVYPSELAAQRRFVGTWMRLADGAFALLFVAGGLGALGADADWGALLVAVGIACALAAFVIEPATARAAFDTVPRRSDSYT